MNHPAMKTIVDLGGDGSVDRKVIDEVDLRFDRFAEIRRLRCRVILLRIFIKREVRRVVRGEIVVPDALLVARCASARSRSRDESITSPLIGQGIPVWRVTIDRNPQSAEQVAIVV